LDPALIVTTWSRSVARMWRLSPEKALGREFFSLPLGDAASRAIEAVNKALTSRRRETVTDVPVERPEGGPGTVALTVAPISTAEGEPAGLVGLLSPDGSDGARAGGTAS